MYVYLYTPIDYIYIYKEGIPFAYLQTGALLERKGSSVSVRFYTDHIRHLGLNNRVAYDNEK